MTTVQEQRGMTSPWISHRAVIRSTRAETPGVRTYGIELVDEDTRASYTFHPGQFNMLYVPGVGESAISISSSADEPSRLEHTIRAVGNVTEALARMEAGNEIGLRGPFGSAWPMDKCRGRDLVIAAGGIGLAPLRPAIYHVLANRGDFEEVCLLYGARRPADLLYTNEYESWRKGEIRVEVTVDRAEPGWEGEIGVVPSLFERLPSIDARSMLFTCGPEIMMRYTIIEGLARGIAPIRSYLSMERNMNCAIGLCGHCQLGSEFICKDGPVFPYPRMAPYLNLEDF